MSAVIKKTPAIDLQSFSCPHCGALAHQKWGRLLVEWFEKGRFPITGLSSPAIQAVLRTGATNPQRIQQMMYLVRTLSQGFPFLEETGSLASGCYVENLHLSECFSCKSLTVWISDRILYPSLLAVEPAHEDMPEEIIQDFNEARAVFDSSPRASAALLRLCIQKLCRHLGEDGDNINADIASLVRKGLNPRLQKALDAVRVTGNEVVHPGVIDLNDDRSLASSLFSMVNLIVEEMISRPKHVEDVYAKLPQSKRDAIEVRDRLKGSEGR